MGAHFSIKPGPVGGGPANASYITRSQAAGDGDELYHNAPEAVENADTWHETKIRLRSWAERVKAEEKARHGNRAGRPRTHYRAVISYEDITYEDVSYEDEIPTEAVKEDVAEFLEEEFPQAKAVAVVHQNTGNSHAHVWMSARKTTGEKVHIGNGDLKEMHATMDEIYERRMGVQSRNAEKVEETKELKRTLAKMKEEGASKKELSRWAQANRPDRATPPDREVYRQREKRLAKTPEGASEDASGEFSGRVAPKRLLKLKEKTERLEEALQGLEEQAQESTEENRERNQDRGRERGGWGGRGM